MSTVVGRAPRPAAGPPAGLAAAGRTAPPAGTRGGKTPSCNQSPRLLKITVQGRLLIGPQVANLPHKVSLIL